MRKALPLTTIAALSALTLAATSLATGAVAQDDVLRDTQETTELRTDWIIGSAVYTPDGDRVGSIDGLLLDETDGRVTAAIVSVGGFLGFGAKQIAVDWNQLQINYDGNEVILPITVDWADEAPEFAFRDRQAPPPPPDLGPPARSPGGGMAPPQQ
jgi:sporulation protein YlmC with PRC-barrel domain